MVCWVVCWGPGNNNYMVVSPHISLITSAYRAGRFLERYTSHVLQLAEALSPKKLLVEVVIVLNEPSPEERQMIEKLVANAHETGGLTVLPIFVERETLYASWNRGIQASSSPVIGFWNVDDVRYPEALNEGYQLIGQGCDLVDFPYAVVLREKWMGLIPHERHVTKPINYRPPEISHRHCIGPFFLCSRRLFDQAGLFDKHFRISGDLDWSMRPSVRGCHFCPGNQVAGTFFHHGSNLSSTLNPREWVEINTALLRQRAWDRVQPAPPDEMREVWQSWGNNGVELPAEIEAQLWGEGAAERWQSWRRERRWRDIKQLPRSAARFVIDHTGLRPLLARAGIVRATGESQ